MLSTTTTIRSWPALLLAGFFVVVTGRLLLDDWMAGAPFSVTHLSSIAALVAAVAAIHYAWPAIRSGAAVAGTLLLVSGFSALGYVMVASGIRNATDTGNKTATAAHVNAQRAGVLKMISEAEYMLAACPTGVPKADIGNRCGLRAAMAAECASGKGKKCDGRSYSVRTYEAALMGHNAQLAALGPERTPLAGYQRFGELVASLPYVTASADSVRATLERLMPYAPVLVIEFVGLGFALLAFGNAAPATGSAQAESSAPRETVRPDSPEQQSHGRTVRAGPVGRSDGPKPGPSGGVARERASTAAGSPRGESPSTKQECEADLLTLLALGQSVPSQRTLAERWGRPKQTVSDWLREWERGGLIPSRRQVGREKMLDAAGGQLAERESPAATRAHA